MQPSSGVNVNLQVVNAKLAEQVAQQAMDLAMTRAGLDALLAENEALKAELAAYKEREGAMTPEGTETVEAA